MTSREPLSIVPHLPAPARVSKERYYSAEFAALERERLWRRVWLHAAPLDLLANRGDFYTTTVGMADILVIRGQDGTLRAFHNVCQHRGRRLVRERFGNTKQLRCSTHHWQYDDDGVLANAPDREVFGPLLDSAPCLPLVACDIWEGQVWVHLGEPEETLAEWLAPVTAGTSSV